MAIDTVIEVSAKLANVQWGGTSYIAGESAD